MPDRPRLTVFRSNRYLYVQFVDDMAGKTLLGCSTKDGRLKGLTERDTLAAAQELGKLAAADATKKGISRVVFDRSGYLYHGRVKAFADAARAGGLQF